MTECRGQVRTYYRRYAHLTKHRFEHGFVLDKSVNLCEAHLQVREQAEKEKLRKDSGRPLPEGSATLYFTYRLVGPSKQVPDGKCQDEGT